MKKIFKLLVVLCAVLCACGDTERIVNKEQSLVIETATDDEIRNMECSSANVGFMVYNEDFEIVLFCDGSSWTVMKGEDGANGIKGLNGKNGKDGIDGKDGTSGSFCTVDNFGEDVFINCDGDTTTVVMDWDVRKGCFAEYIGSDSLLIVCDVDSIRILSSGEGYYTSRPQNDNLDSLLNRGELSPTFGYCGDDVVYNKLRKFCAQGKLYDLCGGKDYDVVNETCLENTVYSNVNYNSLFCNGERFDPSENFCWNDKIIAPYCNGTSYNPERLMCQVGSLREFIVDSRDGQRYPITNFNGVVWMAQNLNYKTGYLPTSKDSLVQYYGRYYNWYGAVNLSSTAEVVSDTANHRGICPEGFRLPTASEYEQMVLSINQRCIQQYKSPAPCANALWAPNGLPEGASVSPLGDISGFLAVEAGSGSGSYEGFLSLWTTSSSEDGAVSFDIKVGSSGKETGVSKSVRKSVRCVKK